jgi:hypothetical protein
MAVAPRPSAVTGAAQASANLLKREGEVRIKEDAMAKDQERITILAREFTAAALEFHRGRMAEKGYRMEGSITPRYFKMIEGAGGDPKDLFNGEPLFAVTFVKKDAGD